MLQLENINAGYNRIQVLHEINLQVHEGEMVSILGANGAGKTTVFRVISGIIHPSQGRVLFQGKELHRLSTYQVVRAGIGQVPEGRQVVPSLSVRDHLWLSAHFGGNYKSEQEIKGELKKIFQLFPILEERSEQLAGSLSGGQQQMLVIARALMLRPRLLLLDEPSLGLAPIIVSDIFNTLKKLNRQGMTILLIEQNAFAALKISHRAYVMAQGKILLEDSAENILKEQSIKQFYLG
jgi:branched-chain amino acid transport system ATP-binding protein